MGLSDLTNPSKIYELLKKGAIVEAQEEIMKYRELVLEQSEEILNLKEKLSKLNKEHEIEEHLRFKYGLYYIDTPIAEEKGPYCQKCWDVDKILVRVQSGGRGFYSCRNCESVYNTKLWQK